MTPAGANRNDPGDEAFDNRLVRCAGGVCRPNDGLSSLPLGLEEDPRHPNFMSAGDTGRGEANVRSRDNPTSVEPHVGIGSSTGCFVSVTAKDTKYLFSCLLNS